MRKLARDKPAPARYKRLPFLKEKVPMFRAGLFAVALACVALVSAPHTAALAQGKVITTASGLKYIDVTVGTGPSPQRNQTAVVHYTGWLYENGQKGAKFDSSVDRGQPFSFPVGAGRVIKGWDEGVASMKVGGKRTLIIPPALGYGARGAGGIISPNSTLMFDVELLKVE
jgi:peptidylprolyl isomerase